MFYVVGENNCTNNNNGCQELCLTVPGKVVCACRDGHESSGTICSNKYKPEPQECHEETFSCRNSKRCIDKIYLCDGADDCGDGSDESTDELGPCHHITCHPSQFLCDKSYCISKSWLCDSIYDCKDKTDEDPRHCSVKCTAEQFFCEKSKRCIPKTWQCDGHSDCSTADCRGDQCDNSDEENCRK